jgi:ribosomal protein L7/L12
MEMAVNLKIAESRDAGGRDKREKFVALAESRTVNAIKSIRIIAKLGNKSAYDFTEADVNKIVKALTKEVEAMKTRMLSSRVKEDVDFNL